MKPFDFSKCPGYCERARKKMTARPDRQDDLLEERPPREALEDLNVLWEKLSNQICEAEAMRAEVERRIEAVEAGL